MKLVIDYNGIKREINGPFLLCANREDVEAIIISLRRALKGTEDHPEEELRENPFYFGWIEIVDMPPRVPMKTNQAPLDWLIK